MNSEQWAVRAHKATVVAAVAAVIGFFGSLWIFKASAEMQSDATAVTVLHDHIQLFLEHPELYQCADTKADPRCVDLAEHAAFTAETIFAHGEGDKAWEETVRGMICDHSWWFKSQYFNGKRYDPPFRVFVAKSLPVCISTKSGSASRAKRQ